MSVSVAEMAGHERDSDQRSTTKKRRHTDEELAERKKKKKQKQVETDYTSNVLATLDATDLPKKKKKRKDRQEEEDPDTIKLPQQQIAQDIELPDVEQHLTPAGEDSTTKPKKRKKRNDVIENDSQLPQKSTPAAQEDVELPDPDFEDEAVATSARSSNTNVTAQLSLPSSSTTDSPFHRTKSSIYVPCPAISLTSALSSLISAHLTPLLLTYYPPLEGIVLSFQDINISSAAASEPGKPLLLPSESASSFSSSNNNSSSSSSSTTHLALCADESGVSFTWLNFTATVFRPTPLSTLSGYINIATEGFIGLVLYNYFQVGISRSRIPRSWKWIPPGGGNRPTKKKPKKARIRDSESADASSQTDQQEPHNNSMETAIPNSQISNTSPYNTGAAAGAGGGGGHWTTTCGILEENTALAFRVVDIDLVPSNTRTSERMTLQIEGSLLDEKEEESLRREEKAKFERGQNAAHGRNNISKNDGDDDYERRNRSTLSDDAYGGRGGEGREGSIGTLAQRHRVAY